MADYHTPTVVTPTIPFSDMTALERLMLEAIFDVECDPGDTHIYLFSGTGPSNIIYVDRGDLARACEESRATLDSTANDYIVEKLRNEMEPLDPDNPYLDIDLSDTSWEFILQDIVKRSPTLDEIVVTMSFTCSRMRPDGFGGAVTLITADSISGKSTVELLEDLRHDAAQATSVDGRRSAATGDPIPRLGDPITRMVRAIDEQARHTHPDAPWLLDRTGNNSLDAIRGFVTSFRHPGAPQMSITRAELDAALCVWEAMLDLRFAYENNPVTTGNIHQMAEVWHALGSVQMRYFVSTVASLAIQAYHDLREDLKSGVWSFDFDFIPTVVENLTWTFEGPERPTDPALFLATVLGTLRQRARDA